MKKRITHISDTHNKHNQLNGLLPGGDLLIHSGDISSLGRKSEVERFVKWFNDIDNYTNKVFIAGNHDMTFDREQLLRDKLAYFEGKTEYDTECAEGKPDWLKELLGIHLRPNVSYLENSDVTIDGIKIWGSPVTPSFGYGWAFNKDRGHDINEVWNTIPMDTDIVITHGPIYGYCDRTDRGGLNVGCEQLYHRLNEVQPRLHFSGHIHEAYGYRNTDWGYAFNGCNCDLSYLVNNKPMTFDYDFVKNDIVDFLM
jgi:Icc-related predicted phosphoesterase